MAEATTSIAIALLGITALTKKRRLLYVAWMFAGFGAVLRHRQGSRALTFTDFLAAFARLSLRCPSPLPLWMLAIVDACAWPATPPTDAFLRVEHGADVAELTASGNAGPGDLRARRRRR